MDINDILNQDFMGLATKEQKNDENQVKVDLYSKQKSMYISYFSYVAVLVSLVGVVLVAVLGLPQNNAVLWGIPSYLYTLAHIVPFILIKKNRRKLKFADESKEYSNVSISMFLLSFMLSFSVMMMFIGRAISPTFMLGF